MAIPPAPGQSRRLSKLPTSRVSLPSTQHHTVDASIKSLRNAIRSVSSLGDAFADESQLLQRLYYKGKNQHRSALFWRKVGEMRRICGRLLVEDGKRLRLGLTLDELSRSFYGGVDLSNKAQRKQAWATLPSNKLIASTMHHIHEYSALLAKAESVYLSAHHSFEQLMQSGYFLPLALTLIAISSRLHSLVVDLNAELDDVWPALKEVASVLQCDAYVPKSLPARTLNDRTAPLAVPSTSTSAIDPNSLPLLSSHQPGGGDEDLGQAIQRSSGVEESPSLPATKHSVFALPQNISEQLTPEEELEGPEQTLVDVMDEDTQPSEHRSSPDLVASPSRPRAVLPGPTNLAADAFCASFDSQSRDTPLPNRVLPSPPLASLPAIASTSISASALRPKKKRPHPHPELSSSRVPSPQPTPLPSSKGTLSSTSNATGMLAEKKSSSKRAAIETQAQDGVDEPRKKKKKVKVKKGDEIDAIFGSF